MQPKTYKQLNPAKALIWRIIHKDNFPWVIEHGLHAGNSSTKSTNWVHIGSSELINKRSRYQVPVGCKGMLNDYVPFYFTPFSPMLLNLHTGYGGVERRQPEEIIFLVSSLYRYRVAELGLNFVFTDMHAYYHLASFYTDLADLNKIDWALLQQRDFKRDTNDLLKFERYQAEALIHQTCPVEALEGVVCYNEAVKQQLEVHLNQQHSLKIITRPNWYLQ